MTSIAKIATPFQTIRNGKKAETNLDVLFVEARLDQLHQGDGTLAAVEINQDVVVVTHDAVFGQRRSELVRRGHDEAWPAVAVLGPKGQFSVGQATLLAHRRV